MKQRPKAKKVRKKSGREKQHRSPPQMAVGWGRAGSQHRPGLFIKEYFMEHGEACAADIYYALSREIDRLNTARAEIGESPFRRPNYSSFSRYFHWFKLLDFIEPTGEREPAIYNFLKKRVFYALTARGASEEAAWEDPISASHPELR